MCGTVNVGTEQANQNQLLYGQYIDHIACFAPFLFEHSTDDEARYHS